MSRLDELRKKYGTENTTVGGGSNKLEQLRQKYAPPTASYEHSVAAPPQLAVPKYKQITNDDIQARMAEETKKYQEQIRSIENQQRTLGKDSGFLSSGPAYVAELSKKKQELLKMPPNPEQIKKTVYAEQGRQMVKDDPMNETGWMQYLANTLDPVSFQQYQTNPEYQKVVKAGFLPEIEKERMMEQTKADIDARYPGMKDGLIKNTLVALESWWLDTKATGNTMSGMIGSPLAASKAVDPFMALGSAAASKDVTFDSALQGQLKTRDEVKASGQTLIQKGAEQFNQSGLEREAYVGDDMLKGFLFDVTKVVPDMLTTIALSAVSGGFGGAAKMGAKEVAQGLFKKETRKAAMLSIGKSLLVSPETIPLGTKIFAQSYQGNLAEGMDEGQAFFTAFVNAYGQSVLEAGGVNKAFKEGGLNKAVDFLKSALGEGFEEVPQNWWEGAVGNIVGGKDIPIFSGDMNEESIINPGRDMYSIAVGAAAGGVGGAVRAPGAIKAYVDTKTKPEVTYENPVPKLEQYEGDVKKYEADLAEYEKRQNAPTIETDAKPLTYMEQVDRAKEMAPELLQQEIDYLEQASLDLDKIPEAEQFEHYNNLQDMIGELTEADIVQWVIDKEAPPRILDALGTKTAEINPQMAKLKDVVVEDTKPQPPVEPDLGPKIDTSKMSPRILANLNAESGKVADRGSTIKELAMEGLSVAEIASQVSSDKKAVRSYMVLNGIPTSQKARAMWATNTAVGDTVVKSISLRADKSTPLITAEDAEVKMRNIPVLKNAAVATDLGIGHTYVQKLGKKLGVDVVFYEGGPDAVEGMYSAKEGRTVFINRKDADSGQATMRIMGHEFTHSVKQNHPELYKKLREVVGDTMTQDKVKKLLDRYKLDPEYQAKLAEDSEALIEEMLADEAGSLFTDKTFWNNVYAKDATVAQKLVKILRDLINKVLGTKSDSGNLDIMTEMQLKEFQSKFEDAVAEIMKDSGEAIPKDSPYATEQYSLVRVQKDVRINNKTTDVRTYEVSFQPEVQSRIKDAETEIKLNTIEEADDINTNAERVKDWKEIYSNAKIMTGWSEVKKQGDFKLENVPIVSLTKGCQRSLVTVERVENGVLPNETRVEACYGGDCWVNKQFNSGFGKFENMEVRDLKLADASKFDSWLSKPKTKEFLQQGTFIRHGQQGDDSHLFASGIAEKWLESCKVNGIDRVNVFITASYAPTTAEQYKALKPYNDLLEIHFSNSGWFHKNEILIRLAEFQKAKDAGLNAIIRIVTNADNISGLEMPNQTFLMDKIKEMGLDQSEVLETPFHDDALKSSKKQDRSEPTGDFKNICCETGKCLTCGVRCMTVGHVGRGKITTENRISTQVQEKFKVSEREAIFTESALETINEKFSVKRARTVARDYTKKFLNEGSVSIVGQTVNAPVDLAILAQVYRDPRFETLRYFFVDENGKILYHTGVSSRLAGATMSFAGDNLGQYINTEWNFAASKGAKAYYILHNHPSGNPTPSKEDINMTKTFGKNINMPMLGHVIVNSKAYTVIDQDGIDNTFDLDVEDNLLKPDKMHSALSQMITSPDKLAMVGKMIQSSEGYSSIVYLAPSNKVRGIQEVPNEMLKSTKKTMEFLKKNSLDFGGARAVLVTEDTETYDSSKILLEHGWFMDVMNPMESRTMRGTDSVTPFSKEGEYFGKELKGQEVKFKTRAYHGTPHDFDKFTLDAIGTGEGAQAYGWGLYFAGDKAVAEWYRDKLSKYRSTASTKKIEVPRLDGQGSDSLETIAYGHGAGPGAFIKGMISYTSDAEWADLNSWDIVAAIDYEIEEIQDTDPEYVEELENFKKDLSDNYQGFLTVKPPDVKEGKLFEVDLAPDEEHMLNLDKRLKDQSDYVKDILSREYADENSPLYGESNSSTGDYVYKNLARTLKSPKAASAYLNSIGIPGNRYLDGSSRGTGKGDYNYVIFDDSAIEVLDKYKIRAYHGTPHDFDKFALDAVGTGEGHQAYGWGLYFAGDKAVAEWYRDRLSAELNGGDALRIKGVSNVFNYVSDIKLGRLKIGPKEDVALRLHDLMDDFGMSLEDAIEHVKSDIEYEELSPKERDKIKEFLYDPEKMSVFEDEGLKGRLFEVDLAPDEEHMLDWDNPIGEQSEYVKSALYDLLNEGFGLSKFEKDLVHQFTDPKSKMTGGDFYKKFTESADGDPKELSKLLHDVGIQGNKYLNGPSRGQGKGDYNYVIFDDSAIEVLDKYSVKQAPIGTPSIEIVMDEKKAPADLVGGLKDVYRRIFDKNAPVGWADEKAGKLASNAAIVSGTLEWIAQRSLVDTVGNAVGKSLKDTVKPFATNKDFWEYMAQRHNIDRAREGKPVDPNMSPEQSAAYVAQVDQKHPEYKAWADSVTSWIDQFMQEWAVKTGIIDEDTYAEWRAMYPSYFPTYREFTDLEGGGSFGPGKKFVDLPNPVKKATGSDRDITNPVGNIIQMMNKVVRTARYNEVGKALYDSVVNNPTAAKKYAEVIPPNVGMFSKLDNVVTVWVDGQPQYLQINDKMLLESLNGIPRVINNAMAVRRITSIYKGLITQYNPMFALRNMFRDVPTAYVYGSQDNPLFFLSNLAKAGYQVATKTGGAARYMALGGGGSGQFGADSAAQYAKLLQPSATKNPLIKGAKGVLKGIEFVNSLTELAPRVSEFNHVLDKTGDVAEALYAAQNVTVNFARGGDVTKQIEPFVPYLNASVQGLDRFFEAFNFKKDPAGALKRMVKAGIAVTAPQIASYLMSMADDEERYKMLDQRTKDTSYVFPKGDGTYIKIPKSREIGVLFASLVERSLSKNFDGFGTLVRTNFTPVDPFENNLAAPLMFNLPMNKDFAGRDIVPQYMQNDGRSPALQFDDNTSEIGKKLGEMANISPKQIDYIIRSYTGVIGQFLLPATTKRSGAGTALQRMTSGAFEADPAFSSQAITSFYGKLDEYQQIKTDRNLKENIPSKVVTMEEKMYTAMNKVASNISKTTKYINANLKADDPKVKALREVVNTYAMKAVKAKTLADLARLNAEFNAALYKEGVR